MQKVIGLVHTRFSPTGGVESYINKLVPALLARNWQIHYFTARIEQHIPPGMIIHKIPVIRGTSISRMLSFAYGAKLAVRQARPPLVMGFGRTIYQDIYRDGSGCFSDYQKYAAKRFNSLYRKSCLHLERKRFNDPRLQKVITVSRMVKEQIISHYHVRPEKVEVVYSGVNAQHLNPGLKKQKNHFRKQLEIANDALTILFIGNAFERKGLQYLIKAVGRVQAQAPIVVLVAGTDKKTKQYRQLAEEMGCRKRIRFLGYQKDVGALYGAADLFVLPSLFDPIANVVLEALYTGTPVVTGPNVGAGELIEQGGNGFVVPDYAPATLAQAILTYYRSPHKEKMTQMAHQAAAAYRWDLHMDHLEKIFSRILEQKYVQRW
ncbi:MAG: glycosyltransferase family 4 protein [Desulfobacterales bacterium]|nr:glycosyltransferase family 4 protein [Desulfobacterales bacterium]